MSAGILGKTQSVVNTTTLDDGDTIGAHIVAGGLLLTQTTIGSDVALDVNLSGLAVAQDGAHDPAGLGLPFLAVRQDTLGSLVGTDGDVSMLSVNATGAVYAEITAQALPTGAATEVTLAAVSTTLTALSKTEDEPHGNATEGLQMFAVRQDTLASLVSTTGDLSMLSVNATGALYTTIASLSGQYAEDSVAADGAIGNFQLGVRRDTSGATVTGDGDFSEFQTWSEGSLRTVDNANNVNLQQIISVGTTATQLPASNMVTRKLIMLQNLSGGRLSLGSSTVTADTTATGGIQLGKGGFVTVEAGPNNSIFGRVATGTKNVAVWEFS